MGAAWLVVRSTISAEQVPDLSIDGRLPMPGSLLGQAVLGVWPRWESVGWIRFGYIAVSSTLLLILSSLYVFWWFIG